MTYFIGVDLHKTQFTVYVKGEENPFCQYATTKAGYAQMLGRLAQWKKAGDEVKLGVESTGNTRFFKNQMEKAGAEVTVINTLKFKIVNESTKKTDKHDAATIAEFLEKNMLPEACLCSRESETIRRLLKVRERLVRSAVGIKNEIHALLVSLGLTDERMSLQSKKGRQAVLTTLQSHSDYELEAQSIESMINIIDKLKENVKDIEAQLDTLCKEDPIVNHLLTFPGCGPITAWTIRAYTDDIKRFATSKKYASFCGLVPWVQSSNKTVHYGKITKRGPKELRTAFVQLTMGIRRSRRTTGWRIMERYERLKTLRGGGKSIIATARKLSEIVWTMLNRGEDFNEQKMLEHFLPKSEQLAKELLSVS